jgi:hypothetical protein
VSFLAPIFLLLAGAAAVPLLLHLLRRNISARVDFPAARYLQRAEREHSRSLRIRNLLLMLLRVLLLLALAVAAAQPVVRVGIGSGHGATAVAIVLDNSLSTSAVSGGAPTFDRLKAAARTVLLTATPADRLWLLTADGRLQAGSRDALLSELGRIAPSEGAGDLPLALRRAAAAVSSANLPSHVVAVVTDGQRSAWSTASRVAGPVALLVPGGDPPANRSVAAVTAEPPRWTPRGSLLARVDAPDSVGYRILLGGRTLARGVAARGEPVTVRLSPPERGWQGGTVELEPDDFAADDARHFAVWIGAPPVVTSSPSAGAFAATALSALVADGRAATGSGIGIVAADQATALPALLLPPTDPVRLGAANRQLDRLGVPWHFGALDASPSVVHGDRLDGVSVSQRFRLARTGPSDSDTLATVNGEPWVVAGAGYLLVGSRLDPAATSLPVRAAFVPWLADVLGQRLGAPAGDLGVPMQAAPGSIVELPADVDAIESESGGRRSVGGRRVAAPEQRGVWFMLRAGRRIGALVVEAPPEESSLARFTASQLAPRPAGREARVAADAGDLARATFVVGTRRPVTAVLLLLALALLAVEAIAVRSSSPAAA